MHMKDALVFMGVDEAVIMPINISSLEPSATGKV